MQTRSKSALKSVSLQQEGACSIGNIPRCTVRINGTALADQLAVAAAKQSPACTTSSDAALAGTIPVEQHAQQPLELLAGIVEAYVSALDDAEAVEAAQAVAGIWHAHDTDTRARLSAVLGPLLERESQLQQRATAIAAKREARRAKVSEQGPRVSWTACRRLNNKSTPASVCSTPLHACICIFSCPFAALSISRAEPVACLAVLIWLC